jgi:hypothetical protein
LNEWPRSSDGPRPVKAGLNIDHRFPKPMLQQSRKIERVAP